MTMDLHGKRDEKKVEYLELIYDLIFVYIIGRNNSLLHHVEGGFVSGPSFLAYLLCTLAVIQIWNFSTFYINMYGRNGPRDHVALFVNMYLLYYIGEGTRLHWQSFQTQYHLAWALILANLGVQYCIELRNHREEPLVQRSIRHAMLVRFGEAALVLLCIPVYKKTGIPLAWLPILFGIGMTLLFSDESRAELIDFAHLSERAMLFVVFTFGEMIIAIASYFDGVFSWRSVYFSAMCFLIVAGLFLCYELLYDHIIDREQRSTGIRYMLIHIFLILAMNNITSSLEFMRDEAVRLWPKTLFLLGSFLLFFICLSALLRFAKPGFRLSRRILLPLAGTTAAFIVLMLLLRENMALNIALSVVYVFSIFVQILQYSRRTGHSPQPES